MRDASLLAVACCLLCASGCREHSDLSGTWVYQSGLGRIDRNAARLNRWTLTLNDDGTFTERLQNHIMMTLVVNARGTYTRHGDTVTLIGSRKTYMDDGYKQETQSEPLRMKLRFADHVLTVIDGDPRDTAPPQVFRREGDRIAPSLEPQPQASDPQAVQILYEMRRRYAMLNTYSDEGTVRSSDRDSRVKNIRFQTRFMRPHKFRFQAVRVSKGKEKDKSVVWSDGKKTWLYDCAGCVGERGLGNALRLIADTSGYETVLVPELLLPAEFGAPTIDPSMGGFFIIGEQNVFGKDCYVIGMRGPEGVDLKLWVDRSSYLILQAFTREPQETMSYQPKGNIRVAESEFRFSPPK
jgi:uncharacterized protein DUF2092